MTIRFVTENAHTLLSNLFTALIRADQSSSTSLAPLYTLFKDSTAPLFEAIQTWLNIRVTPLDSFFITESGVKSDLVPNFLKSSCGVMDEIARMLVVLDRKESDVAPLFMDVLSKDVNGERMKQKEWCLKKSWTSGGWTNAMKLENRPVTP